MKGWRLRYEAGTLSGREVTTMAGFLDFCDLMCRHAEMPKDDAVDGSGSCRTFVAVYCTLKQSLVHKNMPCREKTPRGDEKGQE
jgi:hypothetical protein